jgi:PAS domain S-box-containing protein
MPLQKKINAEYLKGDEKHTLLNARVFITLLLLLLIGTGFTWLTAINAKRNLQIDLLRHARIAASMINRRHVSLLNGNADDTLNIDYRTLKKQFEKVVKTIPDAQFVYLLGIKSDTVFFFLDSEPLGSGEESLPGDYYLEASDLLKQTFSTKNESFEGPLEDQWGVWVSAFIPIINQSNGKVSAVLGIDVSAKNWRILIAKKCILPVSLLVFALWIVFVSLIIRQRAKYSILQNEKIKISEEKYRLLITNIRDVVYSVDVNTKEFIYLSPSFEKITGYSPEDIQKMGGRNSFLSKVLSEENLLEQNNTGVLNKLVDLADFDFKQEAWWLCKNGTYKYLQDHWIPIFSNGKIVTTDGILIDITERKQAEIKLKEADNLQRSLLENIAVGIVIIDPETRIIESVNSFAANLIGDRPEKIIGHKCHRYICPAFENACPVCDKGQPVDNSEKLLIRADGTTMPILKTVKRIEIAGIEKLLESFVDLTIQKETEAALHLSGKKWEAIITASPDGIGMITLDGKIQLLSDKLAFMYGYSKENKDSLIGKDILDFIDPTNHLALKNNFERILAGTSNNKISEYLAVKNDNSRFYVDVNSTLLYDANDNPECILFVERDITERKKVEQEIKLKNDELIKANVDKDRFMSILAHDLKSPFSGLLGLAHLLNQNIQEYDMEKSQKYAGLIFKTAESIFNLLEDLLLWARSQSGKIPFKPQVFNFKDISVNVVESLMIIANNKNISVSFGKLYDFNVYADVDMLKTVLRNLVSNALKFTGKGGNIVIEMIQTDTLVTISVNDSGIGIPPETINKLFDTAKPHSTTGTENESGTGLGLLICREFVEKHGGTIWVESIVGKGSSFKFTLPVLA